MAQDIIIPASQDTESFITAHNEALKHATVVHHASAATTYRDVSPNMSIKDGFSRRDYDQYRPEEALPSQQKDIQRACLDAYENVGPVKNTIDLMTDLVVQGVDIEHRNKTQEKFYKDWFHNYVKGPDRSERLCSTVYRAGTAVVKRQLAKIAPPQDKRFKNRPLTAKIPWTYTILNPLTVDVVDNIITDFIGADLRQYVLKVSPTLLSRLRIMYQNPRDYPFLKSIPEDIARDLRQAISRQKKEIPLKPEEISVVSFKKDDWKVWGMPVCNAILDDLTMLQKMKQADLSALDGAIAQIRLWKIGSLEPRINPTKEAFNRLAEIIMSATSGGVADIMWGPAIDLIETSADLHMFLGEAKYIPVMKNIYQGLGLPTVLTNYGSGGGFSNSVVEIKVMLQRLRYMRQLLIAFWNDEIKLVQEAMGFRHPATITFDNQFLDDEATMLNVLLSAAERNLVSRELVQKRFQAVPEIEDARLMNEQKRRDKNKLPPQADPYHDGNADDVFRKQLWQKLVDSGRVDPADLLEQMLNEDIDSIDVKSQEQAQKEQADNIPDTQQQDQPYSGPRPGTGRPSGSNDKTKRKTKRVTPVGASMTLVENLLWADHAQKFLHDTLSPLFLKSKDKTTARQLTNEEFNQFEELKFGVLCHLEPLKDVSKESVSAILQSGATIPEEAKLLWTHITQQSKFAELPVDDQRRLRAKVVAILRTAENESDIRDIDS